MEMMEQKPKQLGKNNGHHRSSDPELVLGIF